MDKFDEILKQDKYAPECLTSRNSQQTKMQETEPIFIEHFVPTAEQVEYLKSLEDVTFPIKNKSKIQNTHITNFQFETDKHLKQETFMLCFDLMDK
jgi:hypothetical protein